MTQAFRLPDPSLSKLARRSLISALIGITMVFLATFDGSGSTSPTSPGRAWVRA
ncbi:MAG TPA: hypothetical protein VGB47_09290 [Thermoanaerobaculia bacterium]